MDLSILIPSRNEKYLERTIEDIKENSTANTEILWREDYGIGQRALTNELAREAKGKYVMKLDAHCSMGYGFDTKMLQDIDENTLMAPYMLVLDAETWTPRNDKRTSRYCFDTRMVMQYDTENDELIPETMCLQGSCWMVSREKYWEWNLCDEAFGSWGSQAIEIGIKAWNGGGKVKTTKNTYYAHLFRTQDSDFPYDRGVDVGKQANDKLLKEFKNSDIAWLIKKFGYPADWTPRAVADLSTPTH